MFPDHLKITASSEAYWFTSQPCSNNNLIFVIEDTEGNKFGGYIDATIDKTGNGSVHNFITDSKSFVFSLESNGRLNDMKKFDIIKPENAFYLFDESNLDLFGIGDGDIVIFKKGSGEEHFCEQSSFNYEGNQNILCGKAWPETFELKQFIVIQMK